MGPVAAHDLAGIGQPPDHNGQDGNGAERVGALVGQFNQAEAPARGLENVRQTAEPGRIFHRQHQTVQAGHALDQPECAVQALGPEEDPADDHGDKGEQAAGAAFPPGRRAGSSRSYKISFNKANKIIGYKTKFKVSDASKEIFTALKKGIVTDSIKTKTVDWYKHLIESKKLVDNTAINNKIL